VRFKVGPVTFDLQRVVFVHCPVCNENIVERGDEGDVTSVEKAKQYARDHFANSHAGQSPAELERAAELLLYDQL
jgi:hypothetical protein